MRFNNKVFQKIRIAGLLVLMVLLSCPVDAQGQKEKKVRQLLDVVLKVVDESGAPIAGAEIVVGEGITHTVTNAEGSVSFKGYPNDVVTVSAFKYEKQVTPLVDIFNLKTVTLLHAKTRMTSDDDVPLPFNTLKKRNLTGPEVVIPGSYFAKYPSTDIRNALTGLSSMYDIREMDGSPGLSPLEGLQQYRGLSNSYGSTDKFSGMPYVLVDNMPVELQELIIDPSEIESVTLVKGILGTTLYGPAATGGVIYIKTKYGTKNERSLHVDIESGISTVDRMPGYVSGVDYANLQNQARLADGLPKAYSNAAISGYSKNDAYDLKYPNVDYQDMMLKNTMPITRINMSSSGGNDVVQYYSYLGYAGEGDIINMGATSNYNRVTARQNVNVKISDMMSARFGFSGNLTWRQSPNYGYDSDYTTEGTGNAALTLTELPSILSDIHSVPAIAYPVYAYYDTAGNTPWYGVSQLYPDNPIGNVSSQGFYTDRGRTGASHFALDFDLGKWISGLKSTTYLGFNIHNTVRHGKANDYLAYTIDTATLAITRYTGHSLIEMADLYKLMDYYFQRYVFYETLSYEKTFGKHAINTSLTYNQVLSYINGIEEPYRQRNTVWSGFYSYNDKYSIHAVLNNAANSSFAKDYRSILNWSVGANWVVTDNVESDVLNYLKLRVQGGVAGNETYFPNLYYVDRWSSTSTTSTSTPFGFGPLTSSPTWFGTTREDAVTRIYLSRTGNPALTWETRNEINAGVDAILFNSKLDIGVTYYNWLVDGMLSQVSNVMPLLAGYNGARPYYNYNQTRYNAVGVDLSYNHKIGDFILIIGANATTQKGTRVTYDEPQYKDEYQLRTGKPSDAIFGLKYLGKFASDDEAQGGSGTPLQIFDDVLYAGDLKYQDMNDDGIIDDLDNTMIGNSSPRLYYGLNVTLKYKNFDLFINGAGRAFYDIALTNAYYWNGWGDNNYSNFVKDNIGGAYPRLTYYKVNNNFLTSEYWLTKGDYFKIQNIEIAYTIPASMLQPIRARAIRFYIRGANLLTVSKVKDVDPESINSGVTNYPLFRTFTGGVKFNF